jgi:hypothetical protein
MYIKFVCCQAYQLAVDQLANNTECCCLLLLCGDSVVIWKYCVGTV